MKTVLSKAPGALRVVGADPIYSIELGPGTMAAVLGLDDDQARAVLAAKASARAARYDWDQSAAAMAQTFVRLAGDSA